MLLIFCFVLLLPRIIYAFECVPSTRVIEVIESGKYTIGIKPDTSINVTKCSFQSNTDISHTFLIDRPSTDSSRKNKKNNSVSDLGKVGLCQITVEDVNDQGPTLWTLHLSNEETQQNFKPINFIVTFFYKVPLLSDTVHVIENGKFYEYVDSSIKFASCQLKYGATVINWDVDDKPNEIDKRLTSLGEGLCGFVFTNVSLSEPTDWSLTAKDSAEKLYRANFRLNVFERTKDTIIKKSVVVGSSTTIQCGDKFNQDFCYLYDPKGEFVTTNVDCSYSIKTVAIHHLGKWICRVGKYPMMETLDYIVDLLLTDDNSVTAWVTEDENYLRIGCQLVNYHEIRSCRMITPTKQVLNLLPGVAYNGYLSFGTNFKNSTCAIMIRKPLSDADKGQWRCEMYLDNTRTGSFIQVQNSTIPSYTSEKTITTQLGETLKIQCEVTYSSDYCYMKSPNGTEYLMPNNFESRLGTCSVTIDVKPEHVGYWTCFFARKIGTPDDRILIKVTVPEMLLYTNKVEEKSGGNASLMCSSYGLPLKYCRFVAPNSLSYFIENHQNSSRISYNGKGLEYGECGITITNVKTSDTGTWRCITKVGNDYKQDEISAVIDVYIAPTFLENPVTIIGFATTCAVLVVSGVAFISIKQWRKLRGRLASRSISKDSSREDIFGYEYPSYSNLEQEASEKHAHFY
ncbi:hypothetical protein RN001_014444 [Aquatica leii]|uniref:Ig-like domain-containing protein n=1 Tax=Aquatica leii TaxID=1421715 RepID=A0AAN7SN57_9COLE|nr:hypothetical protein RN001_014444 [Aquatica leii]